jgi:hypothetical protein
MPKAPMKKDCPPPAHEGDVRMAENILAVFSVPIAEVPDELP